MIDVESLVVTTIKTALTSKYSGIKITSEYVEVPSSFPCVCVQESDNYVYDKSKDSQGAEYHSHLMYSVDVYSNKQVERKSEARAIMKVVDTAFKSIGFTRIMSNPIPNKDASIYRISARYEGIVAEGLEQQDKTIYQVYSK